MELKAGKLSDTLHLGSHQHLTVTLAYGSIKLLLKGSAGIKICFFSSIRENFSFDVTDYDTLVMEAFDDCSYSFKLS
jgi:hypothetical protein